MDITATSALDQYQLDTSTQRTYNKELGQDEFLELMMQQLKHQDPMEPMDNGEFLGQMAQFSTVSGIEGMSESLENLAQTYAVGQTLQSAQLVGQEVLVETPVISLESDSTSGGRFDLDSSSSDVRLTIMDANGSQVRQIALGELQSGRHDFSWDGRDEDGNPMPSGSYTASITAKNGDSYDAATVLSARIVDSVEFGSGGNTTLNTTMGETLTLDDVRQIRQRVAAQANTNN